MIQFIDLFGVGTLRDLLLGVPVFWIHEPVYIIVGTGAALLSALVLRLAAIRWHLGLPSVAL